MPDLLERHRGLTRFCIVPRETVRASLKVFEDFEQQRAWSRDAGYSYDEGPTIEANKILRDTYRVWPIAVQHGSTLQRRIQRLVDLAFDKFRDISFELNGSVDVSYLERYITPSPAYYIKNAEVTIEGILVNGDSWTVTYPKMPIPYKDWSAKKIFRCCRETGRHGLYEDHELDSPVSMDLFDKIMKLAHLKSLTSPHDNVLQFPQYHKMAPSLLIPRNLAHLVASSSEAIFEPDKTIHGTDQNGLNLDNDAPNLDGDSHVAQVKKSEPELFTNTPQMDADSTDTDETILTPLGTRASSPDPDTNTTDTSTLKVSYAVVLKSPTEQVTLEVNQEPGHGSTEKLVNATKEMWSWMKDKGYNNVRLEHIVELAQKMQVKDGVGGADFA